MLSWQHLLAFIVAVGLLVAVHEFGHYIVARLLGFKVLRFSIGFGRPLLKMVRGRDQTEYVLAAIPLGGYVKMLDEREAPVGSHEVERAFNRRPHWQRILVLLAGPTFNIGFAIVLLAGLFLSSGVTEVRSVIGPVRADSVAAQAGLTQGQEVVAVDGRPAAGQRDVELGLLEAMTDTGRITLTVRSEGAADRTVSLVVADPAERKRLTEPALLLRGLGFGWWEPSVPAIIGRVESGGPADRAGLKAGDRILSFNGELVRDFQQLRTWIETRPGENVAIRYQRDGVEATTRVDVATVEQDGAKVGRLQVAQTGRVPFPPEMLTHRSLGPVDALARGAGEAWSMTALQARIFWRMLIGQVSLKNLSGPLTIAEYAGDSASQGLSSFVGFLVLISLSLGFLNLLPIPILDGGQIVYQLIEWVKGSPLSDRAMALGQQAGVALLVVLMSVALFNDIARQFG